jgi:hypothetical protein
MSIRVGDNVIAGGGVPINKSGMSIFDFKWTDHLLNSPSWLRADTFSWQDGTVYELAYQHLLDDIDGKTLTSETIGTTTIQYYLSDDGHKICPDTEEANVGQIFLDTGVAWYYILDETNIRFKLPRTEFGIVGVRGNVGDYVPAGLPNITGTIKADTGNVGATGAFTHTATENDPIVGNWGATTRTYSFNAANSNSIYGASTTVQQPATQMYLYFYISESTQTAIYNTAGITTEALNAKADLSMFQIVNTLPANPNPNTIYFVISQ